MVSFRNIKEDAFGLLGFLWRLWTKRVCHIFGQQYEYLCYAYPPLPSSKIIWPQSLSFSRPYCGFHFVEIGFITDCLKFCHFSSFICTFLTEVKRIKRLFKQERLFVTYPGFKRSGLGRLQVADYRKHIGKWSVTHCA